MTLDPAATTPAATATTNATATSASRPISHYPSPQQQQQQQQLLQPPFYPPQQHQPLPIRAPNPHLPKPHDSSNPFLYPFGAGFLPKGVRSLATAADHAAAYPQPPPSLVYSHGGGAGVRHMATSHLDYFSHALQMTRPPPLPYNHLGTHALPAAAGKDAAAVSGHAKAAPRFTVPDSNGYKETSARSRDETLLVVRDRRVRITEDASLYALCRSWLRNGISEDIQPQQQEIMNSLPKPLPAPAVASHVSNKKEDEKDEDEQEEDEKSVEDLSPQDLLKKHIKRAKTVRARLRRERLQRITRYRSRLRLLLPPPPEQLRNDTAAGN